MTVLEKYNDVLYPPESELRKQGLNLRTYKQLLKRKAPINRNSSVTNIWGTAPLTGTIHIPVLLVQFTDNLSTQTQSAINESFNSSNYLNGQGISVSKYYTKQSYGDLNIIYDVYDWRTAPQTYSWYSLNSSRNFQLVLDSINLFNSTTGGSNVNFSQYDNDNDGRIDGFVIIYPGVGGIAPTAVWPHTRILKQYTQNIVDGKYLGNVALVPEKGVRQSNQFEISVTTHEFAHVLGLPDLYAIGPQGQIDNGPLSGMSMMMFEEVYCLNKPINLDVWSRYFLGWVAPIELTTDSNKEISLRSINDYPDAVILRNSNMGAREYFIIENRYRNHSDSSNLDNCMFINAPTTYGGFAIYHVDENKIEFDYPNNWVNWDRDNNYFNDTVSWPGVLYEENTINSTSILIFPNDLYFDDIINSCDSFKYFDENQYLCAPYGILDRTTSTYSGVQNPKIRFTAISSSNQSIMTAKMLVGEETATPVTSPSSAQVYYVPTQITLSTSTPGATIYYTTNGSTPTTSSSIYTTPITAPANAVTTIKAIAKKNNFYVSDVMTSVYTVTGTVATPTANQVSGVIDYNSQVILSTATSGATIRYTLDNSSQLNHQAFIQQQ
jgi:M6 family metalloprotease-like protein